MPGFPAGPLPRSSFPGGPLSLGTPTQRRLAVVAAVVQTLIAVVNYYFAREAVRALGPEVLATIRFIGTSVLMSALLLALGPHRQGRPWPTRGEILRIGGLGLLGVTVNQYLFVTGLSLTSPSRAALFYGTTPVFVFLLAVFRGLERWGVRRLLGIVLALLGVVIVLAGRGALAGGSLRGDFVLLVATVLWAGYTALGKDLIVRHGALVVTGIALVIGGLAFLPFGLPLLVGFDATAVAPRIWWAVAYMIVVNTIIAYLLWYQAVRWLPPSRVAVFNNLQPVLTVLLGIAVWGETVSTPFLIGGALALVGVVVTQLSAPSSSAQSSSSSPSR